MVKQVDQTNFCLKSLLALKCNEVRIINIPISEQNAAQNITRN